MGFCTWRGLYTQHGGRHSGSAGRRLGLGGCHPGSLWGRPRSAACVTRRMFGCRTDPIVKTIEHCFGGIPLFGCYEDRRARSRAPGAGPAARARGTGHASRPSARASSAVSHKRRWVDDGVTPGRPAPGRRATILSVPVFAPTWGLLAARPPPPDTRWPLWRGARCGASLRRGAQGAPRGCGGGRYSSRAADRGDTPTTAL